MEDPWRLLDTQNLTKREIADELDPSIDFAVEGESWLLLTTVRLGLERW